ncbi:MAG: hypothetical protein WC627_11150 [Legionella sp.]|jgi:hypothetical protein
MAEEEIKKRIPMNLSMYNEQAQDWKYCFEGKNVDGKKIRIILTFTDDMMPIITVINLCQEDKL